MATVFFCGDPHGRFTHIIRAVVAHRPKAVVLLGDQTVDRPLHVELAEILDLTQIYWIAGNHDSDNERHYDNLFESKLKGRNPEENVAMVDGITIAGIGGVFREKFWNGLEPSSYASYSPKDFIQTIGGGNKWRGGLPLRQRTTVFPSKVAALDNFEIDVLVTHEGPDLHRSGNPAYTRLAARLHVKHAFHGHHHEIIDYPGGIWRGVSLNGIVAMDTKTFELTQIDRGKVSTKSRSAPADPLSVE